MLFIDYSNNNGHVDFDEARRQGARGAWLKVTEGTGFVDPDYPAADAAARKAGLLVGGYHFGHPNTDPKASAELFLSKLNLKPGDLKPVLDIEVTDGHVGSAVRRWVQTFIETVHQHIGEWPTIYTGGYFIAENHLGGLPGPKWIASYGAHPIVKWDAWQYTDGDPKYGKSICHLDTSIVPAAGVFIYKHPRYKRVAAHVKKHVVKLHYRVTRLPWLRWVNWHLHHVWNK